MLPPVKFLLVDDVEDNLLVLSALLNRDNIELLKASSGAEALELLLVHDVALALLDVQMPNINGFELAELMRGSERTRDIPIIFITAGSYSQHRLFKGYESGAVDFLYKPIDPHILKSKADVFFQLYRQKQQLAQELQEKTETLRLNEMFVAILGHDLRNPLNGIVTSADLLQNYSSDDFVQQAAGRLLSSSKRMSRMIDDMLDLARARLAGGIPVSCKENNLETLIQRVIQEYLAVSRELKIQLKVEGNMWGCWDPDRLTQALSNLIGNAIEHGNKNEEILVQIDGGSSDVIILMITNRGNISSDVLPHIFNPFYGRQKQSKQPQGLGLGLYIAQQIINAHQGNIEVNCDNTQHTTFKVKMPRVVSSSLH